MILIRQTVGNYCTVVKAYNLFLHFKCFPLLKTALEGTISELHECLFFLLIILSFAFVVDSNEKIHNQLGAFCTVQNEYIYYDELEEILTKQFCKYMQRN